MFVHHEVVDGVGIAFTDRHGGVSRPPYDSLNLGRSDRDDPSAVVENLRRVRYALSEGSPAPVRAVVTVRQEHTAQVVDLDRPDPAVPDLADWDDLSTVGDATPGRPRLPCADAIVTGTPGVALAVRVADCLPVLLAAPTAGVVAAVHAGRVGLADGILPAAVATVRRRATAHGAPGDVPVRAWIGPAVCAACYEVPAALRDAVAARVPAVAATTSWGTPALDLAGGAAAQLAALGVPSRRIGGCTRTDTDLFSHRRDGDAAGRQAGLVWLAGDGSPRDNCR